ncbi:hypothetical protein BROC_01298 [Candidatus Brocadiaceae bacterium]|nr:hypothetical protein BROC_01298 [Candidatus Brocadiaceae bacterium]
MENTIDDIQTIMELAFNAGFITGFAVAFFIPSFYQSFIHQYVYKYYRYLRYKHYINKIIIH